MHNMDRSSSILSYYNITLDGWSYVMHMQFRVQYPDSTFFKISFRIITRICMGCEACVRNLFALDRPSASLDLPSRSKDTSFTPSILMRPIRDLRLASLRNIQQATSNDFPPAINKRVTNFSSPFFHYP